MNIDYETAVGTHVSKNTNAKTRRILSYLMSVYGKKTLSGQYTNHGFSTETDAILILLKMLKKPIINFISVHSISNIYLFTGIM